MFEMIRRNVQSLLERLPTPEGQHFVPAFTRGTLEVELYAPQGTDGQTPHSRDEVYIIVSGTGTFFCAGERAPFGPGDFLHVPATLEHRFENFSEDFVTWVLFYGPSGGEPL
jgi:mannose-6-phosphate isomerase-like protein (cupin superfamily)